ncbi:unnamed protein product [Gordionus sp. m RMFG-2023]|uniref:inositol oxygenase-like n=1 Tax=Gordionus sp. m RMFG-2023 TaxID=3053472 RepID=UPI0030E15C63
MDLLQVKMMDPSEIYRPEKINIEKFRNYDVENGCPPHVKATYYKMHSLQTLDFVKEMHKKWLKFDKIQLTLMEALELMNKIVDQSDPDTSLPNIIHSFQTAERIRKEYPDLDWFHLTGLIHDLGKIMAFYGEHQWCVVGDTYPLGCSPSPDIVFGPKSFSSNSDFRDPLYNSKYGIYKPHCGLDNLIMSWGHDEYMYQFLKYNQNTLPQLALNIVRFHSFYPWHNASQYYHLCNESPDLDITLPFVQTFNRFDLYTKSDDPRDIPDVESLRPYYNNIISKYFGDSNRKLFF